MCIDMVERMNSKLLLMLRTLEETSKSKWKNERNQQINVRIIPLRIYSLNVTKSTSQQLEIVDCILVRNLTL